MSGVKTFRELKMWQKSIELAIIVYDVTKVFPKEEQYGITSQVRRASVSIPSNIAEGFGRRYEKDFSRFLSFSIGSLFEVQTQLEICFRLKYIDENGFHEVFNLTREIERMIVAFRNKIN